MKDYKAAVIQMNSQPDADQNFEKAYEYLKQAEQEGCSLAGLPEHFAWLGDLQGRLDQAEQLAGQAETFLKETSKELGMYIIGGSFPVPTGNHEVFNRSLLVNPGGDVVARYDKIHLFDVDLGEGKKYRESEYVRAGALNPASYQSARVGRIGMTICYDLRFPELFRALSALNTDLVTVPSAFTAETGKDHWEPLLRARAIENTCYMLAPAQTGVHGDNRETHGNAMIVDPWGDVIADAGKDPGIAVAEISPGRIKEVRSRIPSLDHRKL